MKSIYYKFATILVFTLLTSSCASYKASIRPDELKTRHDVLIVPFKAAPITVSKSGTGTFLLFGPIGRDIVEASYKEEREKIVDKLRKIHGQWNPSIVLAKECSNLIAKSSVIQVESTTIVKMRELPGAESLRQKESNVFTTKLREGIWTNIVVDWLNAGGQWFKKNSSPIQYKQDYSESNADWSLEVFSSYNQIREGEIRSNVILKLFNISSREKIASSVAFDSFQISPIKEISDFKIFKREYRIAANQLCGKALSEMGLISKL